ncbi:MAG: xanthine dehydrogenase family protein subunit M [Betaproteobacteria bacterium]|jgi:carbon-monoxide dehydrogenase medium subunit|nr:xanthine dehydrogenase family protein subunit M [Polynucleobacter sp.]NBY62772.1 xanthine dehydrogenase family protein subunit M [Betaproteobacteria bacterium]
MKAAAFNYEKVSNIAQALSLLKVHGDQAKLIAGGQSLLPALNMRLSAPQILIDLQGISELKKIEEEGQVIRIGAMVTHTQIENSALVLEKLPLLSQAVTHIAHRAIRNLGTWGGSIVYGDPAAEWPACAIALDGVMLIAGPNGQRRVAAKDFFQDLYTTDLGPDEIFLGTEFTMTALKSFHYFEELSRRHGDYAVTGLASQVEFDQGSISAIRLVYFSVAATPVLATKAQNLLQGKKPQDLQNKDLLAQVCALARAEVPTVADITNSATMKTHLVGVLLERALKAISLSI